MTEEIERRGGSVLLSDGRGGFVIEVAYEDVPGFPPVHNVRGRVALPAGTTPSEARAAFVRALPDPCAACDGCANQRARTGVPCAMAMRHLPCRFDPRGGDAA